jgi:hypothetical protein
MRFEIKPGPKNGNRRIRTQFLLFPKTIDYEIRWLEIASWEEEYESNYFNYNEFCKWQGLRWIG